jgi:type IV fimbrial biogenesis protein FimT
MPSRALSRRDPPNGKNGFSIARGFTVIEMMIALAVLAIITSLALPSYRAILEKRQVTSGAQQIAAFLSAAQLEAVKRNERVAVSYDFTDKGDWCIGMVVDADSCVCSYDPDLGDVDGSNTCVVDDSPRVFIPSNLKITMDNTESKGALAAIAGDAAFVFDPIRGMMEDFSDGATFQFLSRPENLYALNVRIGPTGRVSICSDTTRSADGKQVSGYKPCQPEE